MVVGQEGIGFGNNLIDPKTWSNLNWLNLIVIKFYLSWTATKFLTRRYLRRKDTSATQTYYQMTFRMDIFYSWVKTHNGICVILGKMKGHGGGIARAVILGWSIKQAANNPLKIFWNNDNLKFQMNQARHLVPPRSHHLWGGRGPGGTNIGGKRVRGEIFLEKNRD